MALLSTAFPVEFTSFTIVSLHTSLGSFSCLINSPVVRFAYRLVTFSEASTVMSQITTVSSRNDPELDVGL